MAAFSYSAPLFTEEDRQREIALLSNEEKQLIDNELRGVDVLNENADEKELYISLMHEELENIPLEEKTEYEEALITAPELVESESCFLGFLRKHNYNVPHAASNLISYWAMRVKLFGQDKAFLPMTISGAMQDSFDALSTGFFQVIGTDAHGRAIFYHEKPRADPRIHHRSNLLRSLFYMIHVTASDQKFQKKGSVFILNFTTVTMKDHDRIYAKTFSQIAEAGFIKIKAVHLTSPNHWLMPPSLIMPVILYVMAKKFRVRMNFYESLADLEDYGLSLSGVLSPRSSSQNEESFEGWLNEQAQREREI